MHKVVTGFLVVAAIALSGCCGMYTNCNQPSNCKPGANCGCGCDCAKHNDSDCHKCNKVTY